MAKKSCKKGYYWCRTDEKCKKIPKGWHVMPTGYLMRDSEHSDEEETKKNGNGTNGNGNGNGDSSGSSNGGGVSEAKEYGDHEVSMAKSQVKQSQRNLARIKKALRGKTDKDNLPAWLQAKLTDTEHNTDAAAGYMDEARKSGDYSLRDWFTKSRASDGTPGWVQLGGKYAGKPCAKQPGQKTKPKCGSSKMARNLSDKEEKSAFRRKNAKDPNPNRKGAPINVATERKKKLNASYSNWRAELEQLDEVAPLVVAGVGALAATPYLAKKFLKPKVDKALDNATRTNRMPLATGGTQADLRKARGLNNSFEPESEMIEGKQYQVGDSIPDSATKPKPRPTGAARYKFGVDKTGLEGPEKPFLKLEQSDPRKRPLSRKNQEAAAEILKNLKNNQQPKPTSNPQVRTADHYEPEGEVVSEKKDACYKKVKSRYKIWPSAYASGALVKCRKVGAANWGNSTNESYDFSNWRDDFQALEYESVDIIKAKPLQPTKGIGSDMLGEKCWDGYTQKGMKKKGKKVVPNCVKEEEKKAKKDYDGDGKIESGSEEYLGSRDKAIKKAMGKKNCGCGKDPCETYGKQEVKEDWQKVNRKDKTDGMSQKAVNAYKRENPGSKLKTAVTEKNPGGKRAKRRKSFCARSKGQQDMHNIDCSKTPDKAICKARKRWRC